MQEVATSEAPRAPGTSGSGRARPDAPRPGLLQALPEQPPPWSTPHGLSPWPRQQPATAGLSRTGRAPSRLQAPLGRAEAHSGLPKSTPSHGPRGPGRACVGSAELLSRRFSVRFTA